MVHVPCRFFSIDKLPITNSGKLDRIAVSNLTTLPGANLTLEGDNDSLETELTDTELRLKKIWDQVLGTIHHTTAGTDFFHIGGSSILLLNLQPSVLETFGVAMPLIRMFESSTPNAMANWIDDGANCATDNLLVDWAKETSLGPMVSDLDANQSALKGHTRPRVVLLTGASGKLGRALLDRLVADPNIECVHCIGLRDIEGRRDMSAANPDKIKLH